ncbi:MAG: hypothetical protein SGPRY_003371 [Prymnesium sp.]
MRPLGGRKIGKWIMQKHNVDITLQHAVALLHQPQDPKGALYHETPESIRANTDMCRRRERAAQVWFDARMLNPRGRKRRCKPFARGVVHRHHTPAVDANSLHRAERVKQKVQESVIGKERGTNSTFSVDGPRAAPIPLAQGGSKLTAMGKWKCYGVRCSVPERAGVYSTWEAAQAACKGIPNEQHKGFLSHEEALAWVNKGHPASAKRPEAMGNLPPGSTALSCSFAEKDQVKALGARWNGTTWSESEGEQCVVELFGPVTLDTGSPYFLGAEVGSNNTAELSAICEALLWLVEQAGPSGNAPAAIYYDSEYAAKQLQGLWKTNKNHALVQEGKADRLANDGAAGKQCKEGRWRLCPLAKSFDQAQSKRHDEDFDDPVVNESDASESDKEGDGKKPMSIGQCTWPEKPRLPDDKFKEYRAECLKTEHCPAAIQCRSRAEHGRASRSTDRISERRIVDAPVIDVCAPRAGVRGECEQGRVKVSALATGGTPAAASRRDFWHSASELGVDATAINPLNGGWHHDLLRPEVFEQLLKQVSLRRCVAGSALLFLLGAPSAQDAQATAHEKRAARVSSWGWIDDADGGDPAARLRALDGARCTHAFHEHRARGRSADSSSEAARAVAYTTVFNATVVGVLFSGRAPSAGPVMAACGSDEARRLHGHASPRRQSANNQRATSAFCARMERDAAALQPLHVKRLAQGAARPSYWCGPAALEAGSAELKYISRRRADAEDQGRLAETALPEPTKPPSLKAKPVCVDASWPEGAPPPSERVYRTALQPAELRATLSEVVATLKEAERCVLQGIEPVTIPGRLPDTRTLSHCVPIVRSSPALHDMCPRFFMEWGGRLAWPDEDMSYRAAWEGGTSYSKCAHDTVISQSRWRLGEDGRVQKWRDTTDDSMEAPGADTI